MRPVELDLQRFTCVIYTLTIESSDEVDDDLDPWGVIC